MPIAAVDWQTFLVVFIWVAFLVLMEESAVFEILAALMGLPLAVVAWATFETADPFVRMAVLVSILVGSVVIMVHGTFSFIKEAD